VARSASVSADELDRHCRELLATFKVPRRYEFVDELPKTYAGKIKHREVRARFWGDRDVVV
jgi:acyl-CoA synthetase (AMP-forming)/AMP-acid ligase II